MNRMGLGASEADPQCLSQTWAPGVEVVQVVGVPDAPDPHGARFHGELQRGPLNPQQRRIAELAARGATHEQMMEELRLYSDTLERRIHALRLRLDMKKEQNLAVEVVRLGFEAG